MTVLRVHELSYAVRPHFWSREKTILNRVSLEVAAGEIFGFLGPNGAGKTTTIKSVLGLLRPRAGDIDLLGRPPRDPEARRRCGYMPERAYFPEHLSARELLRFHGLLAGLSAAGARRRTDELLELVGLAASADERLRSYSKGMLQRAGLGQALVGDPELVILDEPMSGLDPIGRRDIREIMVDLRQQGKTVFFSTHILPDVEMICDRVGIIARGAIRRVGSLAELTGGSIDRVEISTGPCPDAARADLDGLATRIRAHAGGLEIEAPDVGAANRAIDALRRHGAEIVHVHAVRRSLEDLFLSELDQPEAP